MFELPPLPYTYDALEPYIDARTVEIHHDKHHAAYTANFNAAIKDTPLQGKTVEEIFEVIDQYPASVRNNAGGYVNHNLYWQVIGPKGVAPKPMGMLADAINDSFGSFEAFKEKFAAAAMGRFGSGWAWLVVEADGKLAICSTANQDNPMMHIDGTCKGYPILLIDVWEHAYYLGYQNKRADYVSNFFNIINWNMVESLYADALMYYATKKQSNTQHKDDGHGGCSCGHSHH
ncbi:MAG: superoxide dismutase [Flavobacteriales bacterium]|nr:superoxide dismutase [Flavobacteriales bacterium]